MTVRAILWAALMAAALAACGEKDAVVTSSVVTSPAGTMAVSTSATLDSVSSATFDTVPSDPPDSTGVPSTSTVPETAPTTSTVAPAAQLVIRPDGIGDALFGTDADAVIAYVAAIIGPPGSDSGWVNAAGPFGICPGDDVREVSWGDLRLLFGDTSQVTRGRRHFFSYEHGPAGGNSIEPVGMVTASAVGVGTSLADLFAAHPDTEVVPADEFGGPYFVLADGRFGQLSGAEPTSVVRSIAAGVGCGE